MMKNEEIDTQLFQLLVAKLRTSEPITIKDLYDSLYIQMENQGVVLNEIHRLSCFGFLRHLVNEGFATSERRWDKVSKSSFYAPTQKFLHAQPSLPPSIRPKKSGCFTPVVLLFFFACGAFYCFTTVSV